MSFAREGGAGGQRNNDWQYRSQEFSSTLRRPIEDIEAEAKVSLQESLRTAAETNEIAQVTAETLHEQTEQLERIHGECQQIESNLDTSQYLIKGMKSWWGAFTQMFTAVPGEAGPSAARAPASGPTSAFASAPAVSAPALAPAKKMMMSPIYSNSQHSGSPTTYGPATKCGPPDTIDDGLSQLHDMLGEMKERAVEIGKTLDQQNVMLDSIHQSVETSESRMNKQKRDLDTLLKRK